LFVSNVIKKACFNTLYSIKSTWWVGGATGETGPLVQQRAAMVPRQCQGRVTSLHLLLVECRVKDKLITHAHVILKRVQVRVR